MKKILIIFIVIMILIQFITIDKENPISDESKDFITINNPPEEIVETLKNACYDCHSNKTKYPWYSNVAPASWLIKEHINNGRRHLNFSIWEDYKEAKKEHKIDECIEMIKSGEMPMKGYVLFHSEAELTNEQKSSFIYWLRELKDSL